MFSTSKEKRLGLHVLNMSAGKVLDHLIKRRRKERKVGIGLIFKLTLALPEAIGEKVGNFCPFA